MAVAPLSRPGTVTGYGLEATRLLLPQHSTAPRSEAAGEVVTHGYGDEVACHGHGRRRVAGARATEPACARRGRCTSVDRACIYRERCSGIGRDTSLAGAPA